MINIDDWSEETKALAQAFFHMQGSGMAGLNRKGNQQILSYYTGVTPSNPTGTKNIESIAYRDVKGLLYTETFTYDIDDDIIQIDTT